MTTMVGVRGMNPDIVGQTKILKALDEGSALTSDIALRVGMSVDKTKKRLDTLYAKGLVQRRQIARDQRQKHAVWVWFTEGRLD